MNHTHSSRTSHVGVLPTRGWGWRGACAPFASRAKFACWRKRIYLLQVLPVLQKNFLLQVLPVVLYCLARDNFVLFVALTAPPPAAAAISLCLPTVVPSIDAECLLKNSSSVVGTFLFLARSSLPRLVLGRRFFALEWMTIPSFCPNGQIFLQG